MIIKVQISLSDGGKHVLVYNQDRSVQQQFEATEDVVLILGGRAKAYFEAEVKGDNITIIGPAPDQDW